MGNIERWAPPPLDREDVLERVRADAARVIRKTLTDRIDQHIAREDAGQPVYGLKAWHVNNPARVHWLATLGRGGLPGVYSADWATPIGGGRGEATLAEGRRLAEHYPDRAELVQLDRDDLVAARRRVGMAPLPEDATSRRCYALDHATVAHEVAGRYPRVDPAARAAERSLERLLARAWAEYRPTALRAA